MFKNNKYFLARLESIWNNLNIEQHQYFTCKVLDDLIKYFEKKELKDNITFDEVEYKLSEIQGIIDILNPVYKKDLKIFNSILNELKNWNEEIEKLNKIYKNS